MQILTINYRNFGKLSRNPSYKTKVKMFEHRNSEILAKIGGKEAKCFC